MDSDVGKEKHLSRSGFLKLTAASLGGLVVTILKNSTNPKWNILAK